MCWCCQWRASFDDYLAPFNCVSTQQYWGAYNLTYWSESFLLVRKKKRGKKRTEHKLVLICDRKLFFCSVMLISWWHPTMMSGFVLSLGNSLEDNIVDPICLVVKLKVMQYHNTQHRSWVCKVMQAIKYHSSQVEDEGTIILMKIGSRAHETKPQ